MISYVLLMNTSAGSCFLFGTDFVPLLLLDASSVLLSLASHTIIIALGYSWQQADLLTEYCPFRPNYSASFSTWLHPMRKEVHKRASWLLHWARAQVLFPWLDGSTPLMFWKFEIVFHLVYSYPGIVQRVVTVTRTEPRGFLWHW